VFGAHSPNVNVNSVVSSAHGFFSMVSFCHTRKKPIETMAARWKLCFALRRSVSQENDDHTKEKTKETKKEKRPHITILLRKL
jgi:hypothetical protein